jgi:toxin CcdB
MAQFTIYSNINKLSNIEFPYLLDIQSPLLSDLSTRLVIPITHLNNHKYKPFSKLTPIITIKAKQYLLLTPQMAGISKSDIGLEIIDISSMRFDIIAAIDVLITGI